ncbi:MAG: hypothetical protein KDK39_11315 [Leptospiraceae bacterium]|nr:hypothetical protein [Leptospiraceae bacterium]
MYRGRIAPSPTGYLHTGHARTFYTAWQRARQTKGQLVYRNEDLDALRCRSEFAAAAIHDLRQFGLDWDEGPDLINPSNPAGGPYGPYNQSERGPYYLQAWQQLFERGVIYPCPWSRADIRKYLETQEAKNGQRPMPNGGQHADSETVFPAALRSPIPTERPASNPGNTNWRLRLEYGRQIYFQDQQQGPQVFTAGIDFGDFLIWRKDGWPSYELAVVVDDAAMQITEVVRGMDLLLSTARQIILYELLHAEIPAFYHCELVTDQNGQRLAKRHASLALRNVLQQISPVEIRATLF